MAKGKQRDTKKSSKQGTNRDSKGRFLPGTSGNPGGRPQTKILTGALIKTLSKKTGGGINYELVAKILVSLALGGKIEAIKEIFDRVEGKAPQSIDVTTDGESINPYTDDQIERVARRVLKGRASDDDTPGKK